MDAFWSIVAADGDHERGLAPYLRSVRDTWGISDHFWLVRGYEATRFGFWPVEGGGAYRGPIRALGATVPGTTRPRRTAGASGWPGISTRGC